MGPCGPVVSPRQHLGDTRHRVEYNVGTDVLGFVFLFSLVSLSVPHFLTAAVWTPPCLAAAWIPSAQDVSPRWVNIVFLFLRARGVVVSRVLVPCPLSPCGLACRGSQDGPSCPRRAALPLVHLRPTSIPITLQGVRALPHSTVSLTACGLGRGATPTFLFRFQGLCQLGDVTKPEGQSWSPKPLRIPMLVQPLGFHWASLLPLSPCVLWDHT